MVRTRKRTATTRSSTAQDSQPAIQVLQDRSREDSNGNRESNLSSSTETVQRSSPRRRCLRSGPDPP